MKIPKFFSILVLGYLLHMLTREAGSISYQYRFTNCIVKMHEGTVPKVNSLGRHYCLAMHVSNFEKVALYDFNLYDYYDKYIGYPKIEEAYKKSQER